MRIYSALYNDYAHLEEFGIGVPVTHPEDMTEKGILILHGGEDISPSLYGQKPSKYTFATAKPSKRDAIELALFNKAKMTGMPIFGICRGAQFLTAMAGGTLVQDVNGHTSNHAIDTTDGERMFVTSAHHQMCNPSGTEHELLAWSTHNRSDWYHGENGDVKMDCEPEVIYYPKIKALAVQPHPEWMSVTTDFVQYLLKLVKERLL